MTDHATPSHPAHVVLSRLLSPWIEDGEVDLVDLPAETALEIQAEEWTLHIAGWPIRMAFIAIDDEPESTSAYDNALRAAIPGAILEVLGAFDLELDGAASAALISSTDGLSAALGRLLKAVA